MATMPALPPGTEDYDTGDGWDEAFEAPGVVREHYLDVLESLAETGVQQAARDVEARLREQDVTFGGEDGPEFVVDPVPRLLTAEEWEELTTGLRQRVLALDAFVADMNGPRRAVADGVIAERIVEGSVYLEADLQGLEPIGEPAAPDATLRTDPLTLNDVLADPPSLDAAVADGRVEASGDVAALRRLLGSVTS
jgi:hypothetical protein